MEISERAAQLTPSLTLSIDSKAKAMKAEGIDVCGFGAGEPDFDTPEHIKKAAIDALEAGFTKYTPSAGIPELRQAIAEKLAADNGLSYRSAQVIVLPGHGQVGRCRTRDCAHQRAQLLEDAGRRLRKCNDTAHQDVDHEQPVQSDWLRLYK